MKKGFTIIELVVSFVIISFVSIAMFKTVISLMDRVDKYQTLSKVTIASGTISNAAEKDLIYKKVYGIDSCGCNCYDITFQDLSTKRIAVDEDNNKITYGNIVQKLPDDYSINGLSIERTHFDAASDKYNTILKISIPISDNTTGTARDINIVYQYDNRDTGNLPTYVEKPVANATYSCSEGINKPVLFTGMTAVKWNEVTSVWDTVADPVNDTSWYNYNDKKWANAKTADGSMWVWIPRYIYKIATNWHTNNTGIVLVRFSMGTDDTRDGRYDVYTSSDATSSNNVWSNEPAFTLGDKELRGIWVAKFEASSSSPSDQYGGGNVTNLEVRSLPSVTSWRYLDINTAYNNVKNMETKSSYGWSTNTTTNGLDPHLMKNVDWGAVTYLAQSVYGKSSEIWKNNSMTSYITGCSGSNASAAPSTSCSNAYSTSNGQQSSTTGNIYGIYDMAAGSAEMVSAYVGTGNANGTDIVNASTKYKDVYTTGGSQSDIYNASSNKKGDAVYETSNNYNNYNTWYGSVSNMVDTSNPWFIRGGGGSNYDVYINSTIYSFGYYDGYRNADTSFRPVLAPTDEAPVLTLVGSNPTTLSLGSTYSDAGATAMDDVDGDITSSITVTSNVNPSVLGTYTITYNVTDSSGNSATPITRTVNVVDNTGPTVVFSMNGNVTYAKSRTTTVTVSDNGTVNTSSLKYLWTTSSTAPAEGSFGTAFTNGASISTTAGVTGTYYLWILAKDTSSNTSIVGSNAFYLDNTIPVITLVGASPVTVSHGATYSDAGATASDNINGNITGSISTTSNVNTSVDGTYTVTYNVSDSSGNAAATVTRTVNVITTVYTFGFTGVVQSFAPTTTGTYQLEVWGAQGGGSVGGKGGYSIGNYSMTSGVTYYIYVGGQGNSFNGGAGAGGSGSAGGGATDVRTVSGNWNDSTSLNSRVIVAGGGGGTSGISTAGGAGGGAAGENTYSRGTNYGGTQTYGGSSDAGGSSGYFGGGGTGEYCTSGAGGGGGWYGGAGSAGDYPAYCDNDDGAGGAGGSGYIGKVSSATTTIGTSTVPIPAGGTETGHSGNGYARITFVS